MQDRVGLVPHKKVSEPFGVFYEADVLTQRVLLQFVHQLLLFFGVEEGHIVDFLLISTDQVYLVDLHLYQFVHQAILVAELNYWWSYHVFDGMGVGRDEIAGVALRF